jgi:hypothetical protein
VRAALAIQRSLIKLNRKKADAGKPALRIDFEPTSQPTRQLDFLVGG